jgi:L-ribulose-5-phosphate 3-epimerase
VNDRAALTKIGIMEGRLLPPDAGRFQAFPRERWAEEFELAAEVPLSYIEWIYDAYGADVNPLMDGVQFLKLQALIKKTGTTLRSMCADYFMDYPFFRCTESERIERQQVLEQLLSAAANIGMLRIVIPFVDASRIETEEDSSIAVRVLTEALPTARAAGIELHLETALGPRNFADLLERVQDDLVKVNYDSGNSSSLGFDPVEEFAAYGARIGSIHIKDRVRGGGTVPLGTGDANFAALFACMEKTGYRGDITLQVARAEPGNEVSWARSNREFVARYWPVE